MRLRPFQSAHLARAACLTLLAAHATSFAQSDDTPPFTLLGNAIGGIDITGFLQLGVSTNNTSKHGTATAGYSNLPVVGPSDEGAQFNGAQIAVEKPIQSNILPRITPLPGPVPWEFSWGFRAELLYGRNGLPATMQGFDSDWGINATPAGIVPGTNRQNYTALPQVFVQAYLPYAYGMTVMVGRFGSGVGREIPPQWRPGPNFFYSKLYAFVAQPDQVAGGLFSANLMRNEYGLLAGELGLVQGRQNWRDNNSNKSVIGAVRWRSTDMATWVDYSFMIGNEQNAPDKTVQAPVARVISPRGQRREHHSLAVTVRPTETVTVVSELVYGRQRGDGRPDTIDILRGPFYTGGRYGGINSEVRYRLTPTLQFAARAELFRDRQAVALFPVTAVAGDFQALTVGASYDVTKNVTLRPELRFDRQAHNNGVKAFGAGTASQQTTVSADMVVHF